jgi:hypothetical protein
MTARNDINSRLWNIANTDANGNITGLTLSANLVAGNITLANGQAAITYTPASATGQSLSITAANTQGGTGYADVLKVTNASGGATNPNKTFRLSSTGALEIVNSAYNSPLVILSDDGIMTVSGSVSAGTIAVSGNQAVNGPAFRAYIATAQTITSGTQQKVTFGTETFDTNSNFATSRFTPTVAGYYQFNATVRIAGTSGTSECMIILYKNGAEYARGTNESGTEQGSNFYSMQVSDVAYANGSTDYFEVYIQQSSGSSRDTTAGSAISYFSGVMVRGA